MTEIVLRPLADAFMQVGVFVALLAVPFGWARHRWGQGLDDLLRRHRRLGPVLAALFTAPPGCGGAIVVVALYSRGAVSFGSVVAALVATMGDATWVLLAADPVLTLQLKALLISTGMVTGCVVDAVGLSPRVDGETGLPVPDRGAVELPADVPPPLLVAARTSPLLALGPLPAALWLLLGSGAVVSVPVTLRMADPAALGAALLGGVDPYLLIGVSGAVTCLLALAAGSRRWADDDVASAHPCSMTEVLRHGGHEIAFVTTWVAGAFVGWAVLSHVTGFDGSHLPVLGAAGVLIGAVVGLIPGCALQIVFAGLFVAGGMPLPTLVANSISQDGDALIPLLAVDQRSAVLATALTTVPAVVVGMALLLLT